MSATVESILTLAAEIAEKEELLRQDQAAIDEGIRECERLSQRITDGEAQVEMLPAEERADELTEYSRMHAQVRQQLRTLRQKRDEYAWMMEDTHHQADRVAAILAERHRLDAELPPGDEPFWAWLIAYMLPPAQGSDWIGELRSQIAETPQEYRSAVIASHLRVVPQLLWYAWAGGYGDEVRRLRAMASINPRGLLRLIFPTVVTLLVTVAVNVFVPFPWSTLASFGWSAALFTYALSPPYLRYRRLKRQQQNETRIPARLSRMRSILRTAEVVGVTAAVTVLSINQAAAAAAGIALSYWAIRRGRDH